MVSLAPVFRAVLERNPHSSRFMAYSLKQPDEKPLKRLRESDPVLRTWLKPGVNEKQISW